MLAVPALARRDRVEAWLIGGAGAMITLFLGPFIGFALPEIYRNLDPAIVYGVVAVIAVGGLVLSIWGIGRGQRITRLSDRMRDRELVMTGDSLTCATGLLEGDLMESLLNDGQPSIMMPWDQISGFVVEPSSSHGAQRVTPPYYKVERGSAPAAFIHRKFFHGREQEILDFARRHFEVPLELRDDLLS